LNPAEPWRCADPTHVLRHHITTPFFHRMDLQDKNGIDSFITHFVPTTYQYEFAVHTSVQLHEIADWLGVLAPRYPPEIVTIKADANWLPPGVYGPRCTNHEGLIGAKTFGQQQVPGADGSSMSFSDALIAWVNSGPGLDTLSPELVTTSGIGSFGLLQCPP
jgi:hypothetical protein